MCPAVPFEPHTLMSRSRNAKFHFRKEKDRCFLGYYITRSDRFVSTFRKERASALKTGRAGQYVPPKSAFIFTRLHGVISQETVTPVTASEPTSDTGLSRTQELSQCILTFTKSEGRYFKMQFSKKIRTQ